MSNISTYIFENVYCMSAPNVDESIGSIKGYLRKTSASVKEEFLEKT